MPLLSPLGDRHTKRQLVVWAMLAFALSAAGMALFAGSGRYHIGPVIGVQAVAVCAAALLLPATHSMVVELVPAAQVTRALGLQQSAQSAGRLLGPAIGGTALAALGTASTLWLYCALLVVLVGMTHRMLARPLAFRSRMVAGAITTTQVASALGPALAGAALARWNVGAVFACFGVLGGLLSLGLMLVPGFRHFMGLDHEAADGWYAKAYPHAFPPRRADS